MSDLISRQQAIDKMQMFIDSLSKEATAYKSLRVAFNRCIIELKRMPSAQQERDIPVKPIEMNDLISRQKAKDMLWNERQRLNTFMDECAESNQPELRYFTKIERNQVEADIDILDRVPSAQPHWIPCSERLPEESGRYLVTRGLNACGSLWNRIYIANYSDLMGIKSEKIWWQGNVGKSDFERLDDVLAWMPLPKPYGGESDV